MTTMNSTIATTISIRVNPRLEFALSMLTVPPRWGGRSLPGSLRYITHQLRRLRPVGIRPPGRDVDLLATRHRDRIRDHPRAGEDRRRVGEGSRGQRREVLALQVLHLHLSRHEAGGEDAALRHAARARRDHRRHGQDADREEGQCEDHLDQAEAALLGAVPLRFHRMSPHWTVTMPVGRISETVREYPSEFVKINVNDWLAVPSGLNVVQNWVMGFVPEFATVIQAGSTGAGAHCSPKTNVKSLLSSSHHPKLRLNQSYQSR